MMRFVAVLLSFVISTTSSALAEESLVQQAIEEKFEFMSRSQAASRCEGTIYRTEREGEPLWFSCRAAPASEGSSQSFSLLICGDSAVTSSGGIVEASARCGRLLASDEQRVRGTVQPRKPIGVCRYSGRWLCRK